MVIHIRAPYTASQLSMTYGDNIIGIMQRECSGFSGLADLESDVLWFPVVVHGILAQPLMGALKFEQEEFWLTLEQTGSGPLEVGAVHVLCQDNDIGKQETLSVKLTFSDVGAAEQLLALDAMADYYRGHLVQGARLRLVPCC
ncbi:hypothetical protein B0H10DRAFT_1967539 [Mycena sp. CBHHK59/15]|nr:hypothetical protein B0H10DRAFT_1967539 [Mycena sp. CBHHK59/15]